MAGRISRRDVLKLIVPAIGGTILATSRRLSTGNVAPAKADEFSPQVFLPFMAKPINPMYAKVVHVHAPSATVGWNGQTAYWSYVNQSVVNEMVNRGVTELTGASTVADAWRTLIPEYQPGQKIAIKVNFNNCNSCNPTSGVIDALIQPVNAVVSGLEQIGVARSDVCVYDAVRSLPYRFINGGLSGISFYNGGSCTAVAGFTNNHYVTFNPPEGITVGPELVNDVLYNAVYLINIPILKGGHPIAGVTLGYKNHFGTVNNPGGMHNAANVVGKPPGKYDPNYNPLVDLMASPLIGQKTVLTVGDGIFAAKVFNQTPVNWTTFSNQVPNSLFFSIDPVAIDCVMHDHIKAEVGAALTSDAKRYLELAASAGQGVFESINPWSSSYSQINYHKIEI